MEEVTKCRYIDCVDTRGKEQILHELPVCDTSLCVRWLINSGHVDLIGSDLETLRSMKFFVCNNHFTDDCYLSKGTLKENAVPSPHWSAVSRTLKNLKTRRRVQLNGQESSMEEVAQNQQTQRNDPSEFQVDQWCRTCATKKQNLVSMTTKAKDTDMSLLSKLKLLIEIDDEDALPTKMCDECVDKLEQSFKFFQQIYVADNTLRHVFPNTRTGSTARKPLHSIGEHMRNEQREREKEAKEKDEEEEEEEESQQQQEQQQHQQQLQDRGAKVSRGIFRRGRGRPRTRGYAARARSKQRAAQMHAVVAGPNVYGNRKNENATTPRNESGKAGSAPDDERQGDTVFSLLTDTCRSDEELDWSDVLKVMSNQSFRATPRRPEVPTKPAEERVAEPSNVASAIESTAEATIQLPTEETKLSSTVEENVQRESTPIATEDQQPSEPPRISCEFCEQPFKLRRQLQTHLLTDHAELSGHMCTDCLTCYETESLLSKHRSIRHGDRRYRCEHCQLEFLEKKMLREHVHKCQPPDASRRCADKRSPESSVAALHGSDGSEVHEAREAPEPGKHGVDHSAATSEADANGKRIGATDAAADELEEEHGEEDGEEDGEELGMEKGEMSAAICPDCNEQTQDPIELSIHRMRRHSINRKDTTCLLCDNKSFPTLEEYEQHVLDHCKRLRISP